MAWIRMGTFGVPQCPQIPVHCNIGIRKFRWMTFHFLIRCKGGSIQTSEIPYGMYNYEWNSHLMGRFLPNISAIICFAFVLLLSFSLSVGSCHIACFSHMITAFFYHHLKSHVFPQCRGPPFDVQRTGSGFDPKGGPENHHVATVDTEFSRRWNFPFSRRWHRTLWPWLFQYSISWL